VDILQPPDTERGLARLKGSPPQVFRMPRVPSPPTPRQKTPRAPKQTPRLSPRGQLPRPSAMRNSNKVLSSAVQVCDGKSGSITRNLSASSLSQSLAGHSLGGAGTAPNPLEGATGTMSMTSLSGDAPHSCSGTHGTTTPSESGDAYALRRTDGKQLDSRIMKLIGGGRSVLSASNLCSDVQQRRREREMRGCAQQRATIPASPVQHGRFPNGEGSHGEHSWQASRAQVSKRTSRGAQEAFGKSDKNGGCALRRTWDSQAKDLVDKSGCDKVGEEGHETHETTDVLADSSAQTPLHRDVTLFQSTSGAVDARELPGATTTSGTRSSSCQPSPLSDTSHCSHTPQPANARTEEFPQECFQNGDSASESRLQNSPVTANLHVAEAVEPLPAAPSSWLLAEHDAKVIWPGLPTSREAPQEKVAPTSLETALCGSTSAQLPTLLQNEFGSLIQKHTWQYVLPAMPDATPAPVASVPPASKEELVSDAFPVSAPVDSDVNSSLAGISMDVRDKQRLLADLVTVFASRATQAERELGSEQRANNALRVTLEVMQKQNLCLQQQVRLAQSWPHNGA